MPKIQSGKNIKKILVVDDHPVMLTFMNRLLTDQGYQVRTAGDGLSALHVLKGFIPDVMFVDLIMPNIGGEKLCRIVRRSARLVNVSLVVISAVAAESEINFSEIGADACIVKGPFNEMKKYILQVLNQLAKKDIASLRKTVIGIEKTRARTITKELLAAERHFELILNNIADGILELNDEGKIIYVNPAAASRLGSMEEELLAKDFTNLFHKKDRQRVQKLLAAVRHDLEPIREKSPFVVKKQNVCLNILPVKDGQPPSMIVILY